MMDTDRLLNLLERIANALERMAPAESAPNLTYDLSEFKNFDWGAIGAKIEVKDQYGPAIVIWQGNRFVRRSPDKYDPAIFYSRCIGKEDNRNVYEKLVTFKELPKNARPISREAESKLN